MCIYICVYGHVTTICVKVCIPNTHVIYNVCICLVLRLVAELVVEPAGSGAATGCDLVFQCPSSTRSQLPLKTYLLQMATLKNMLEFYKGLTPSKRIRVFWTCQRGTRKNNKCLEGG